MKKIILVPILLLLVVILLNGCFLVDSPNNESTKEIATIAESTGETTNINESEVEITTVAESTSFIDKDAIVFSSTKFYYTIVCPEKSTQSEIAQLGIVYKKMTDISNSTPAVKTDEEYHGNTYSAEAPEILIGHVSYPEVQEMLLSLSYNEYGFGVIGNKLVITAWGDIALENAVAAFNSYAQQNTVNGTLVIPFGYRETGVSSAEIFTSLNNVPIFESGKIESINGLADGFTQLTIKETNETMFSEYRTILSLDGYTLYTENKMSDNQFVTYTKGTQTVYAYYIPYSGTTHIIASIGALLPANETPIYTKVRESSITLFDPEAGGKTSGLGMLMQLEDGSFIIIDGGNNTSAEVAQIYSKLIELAPDSSNIIIRAWIITHAHGDHYGAFIGFSTTYSSLKKIKIESFIFNFCDTAEQTQYLSGGTGGFDTVRSTISKYYPTAQIYKCLTGQVFHFAGTEMEILNCMSDFVPQIIGLERSDADLTNADGNIQSIVVRFRATATISQTIMVTGDATKISIDEMCQRFGSYLKSDIMTVPHHGWDQNRYRAHGGTIEFYSYVNPSIVLWPDGKAAQAKKILWDGTTGGDWENNYYLINSLNVKKCIVSGGNTVTLTLPYYG